MGLGVTVLVAIKPNHSLCFFKVCDSFLIELQKHISKNTHHKHTPHTDFGGEESEMCVMLLSRFPENNERAVIVRLTFLCWKSLKSYWLPTLFLAHLFSCEGSRSPPLLCKACLGGAQRQSVSLQSPMNLDSEQVAHWAAEVQGTV